MVKVNVELCGVFFVILSYLMCVGITVLLNFYTIFLSFEMSGIKAPKINYWLECHLYL